MAWQTVTRWSPPPCGDGYGAIFASHAHRHRHMPPLCVLDTRPVLAHGLARGSLSLRLGRLHESQRRFAASTSVAAIGDPRAARAISTIAARQSVQESRVYCRVRAAR
jgi:hypothetical protein